MKRRNLCKAEKQAYDRAKRMRKDAKKLGIWFDGEAADKIVNLLEKYCKHWKGKMAGKPFILAKFQRFVYRQLFGWKVVSTGMRLFRKAFILLPRKNAKTFTMAGLAIAFLTTFAVPGGEVYSIATKAEQAKRVFDDVTEIVKKAPVALRKELRLRARDIKAPRSGSIMKYLASDKNKLDGLNIIFAVIDEIQEHKDRKVHDIIMTSTMQQDESLVAIIGTSGEEDVSIAREQYDYAKAILDPGNAIDDLTYFAFISEADDGDDWESEETWYKANPLLGSGISIEKFRAAHKTASQIPTEVNAFKRLNLNIWVQSSESVWFDPDAWDACQGAFDFAALKDREWVAGLDLSSSVDLTCLSLLSVPKFKGEPIYIQPMFFLPEDNLHKKVAQDRVPYDVWRDQGYLITTRGNVTDYNAILTYVLGLKEEGYKIIELHHDDWNSTSIINPLIDAGFECIRFVQGLHTYHPVCQLFEEKILAGEIQHDNPILTWNARNIRVKKDDKGKMQPTKKNQSSVLRIDGIVASLMGFDYFVRNLLEPPAKKQSFFAKAS